MRISVYSDNLAIFWKSVQEAFSTRGSIFCAPTSAPTTPRARSLLTDDLCHALAGKRPCYIFIDDFHLLTDNRVPAFLCTLTNRLPENVHLIVASRDRFLPAEEILRLGGRLYTVGAELAAPQPHGLSIYAHRCGTELSDAQIESLLYSSEGWFSAIYLNLRTLHERGELPSRSSDIYAMFSAAMIDPLPSKRREFLAVMGLADEFTVEMAETVTGSKNTAAILQTLTEQNAFVKRLPDGVTFRFHHMMKDCAERTFHTMEPRRQAVYHNRYGEWYKTHGQYLHALKFYCLAKNYDAALRVIQRDAGILLTSLGAQQVLDFIAHCPVETLKEHPLSLLVLMRSMFTWRQIPKDARAQGAAARRDHRTPRLAGERARRPSRRVRPHHELFDVQRHLRDEPPAPQRERADVAPRHQHPEKRGLDVRLAVGADDVLPRAWRAAKRAPRDGRVHAALL
ncbi:MAG: hypothetical protein ACLRSD_12415 [Oscillibacter sp.]